jgi:processive 1,2-diacylglycerol beta-glucosyltransferase
MGAGHDGAARGLAAQLTAAGYSADVRDFLDSGPLHIGSALRSGYEFELKHVPAAYDATYRLWYRAPWLCPLVTWIVTLITRRKVLRWVQESGATAVVSTYPLATLCLGRLRSTGRLRIPTVNFITDFGVHPLWVHDGVDLNLAIHDGPAQMANQRTGRPAIACGPVVSARFAPEELPDRALARSNFGLAPHQRAVLVVAGSWGVGDLRATWNAVAGDGRFTPVVVCGRDPRLHDQVSELARTHAGDSVVLGWSDDMPALMAACDALVENAGGLTSLEAMRAGLPVVSFQPIAGHGKENTAGMAAAGVSKLAHDPQSLADALEAVTSPGPSRDDQVSTAAAMFRADAAEIVGGVAAIPAVATPARRPALTLVKAAAALVATASLAWAGLTSGVALAAEAGAGVAHPVGHAADVAYVGVRLDSAELSDPGVVSELQQMHVTAVVDDATALANVGALRSLVQRGINVENGGYGDASTRPHHDNDSLPWIRAQHDARAGYELGLLIGEPVTVTIPGRRVNAFDLIECRDAHTSLVVPNHILAPASSPEVESVIHLSPGRIYLINGLGSTPAQLSAYLSQVSSSLQTAHLSATPLATLA